MKKACCENWKALVPSIREAKEKELKDVEPSYLSEPVLSMLNKINQFCPVCGDALKEGLPIKVKKNINKANPIQGSPPSVCPRCKGKLKNKDGTACLGCMGTGDPRKGFTNSSQIESLG